MHLTKKELEQYFLMEIVNCEQRSEEWFKLRTGVITASAAHKFAYSQQRKTYFYQILSERLTGKSVPLPINEYMEWGIKYEPNALEWYKQKTGHAVEEVGFVFMDDSKLIGCSPDGMVGEDGLVEIKCPMTKTHVQYIVEGPKLEYRRQMQFQMMVTGRQWCDFVTFDPRCPKNLTGYVHRIERDDKLIETIKLGCDKMNNEVDNFIRVYGGVS